jgi:hypothetical protein
VETIWIFEYGSGKPFAFSTDGDKTWFSPDGKPWAFAGGDSGWLWSYETRQALGFFSGNTFFSLQGKPLYFKGT